jgi:hypothetical protein
MFKIPCDKCNGELVLDHKRTVDVYTKTMNYLVSVDGKLDPNTIQAYMLYTCLDCNTTIKLTIAEVYNKVRYELAKVAMDLRQQQEYKRLRELDLEDNSASVYCGKCMGSFNNGHCLTSIYNVCSIRKKSEI